MGYYGFNQQHLDFVFLEYIGDLLSHAPDTEETNRQAAQQTDAELGDWRKWGGRVVQFVLLQALAVGAWCWLFTKGVVSALTRWKPTSSLRANATFGLCLVAGATGFHHQGPYGIRINTLVPGWVMTERQLTRWVGDAENKLIDASQALKGRVYPDDIARMALFLAADDSRMISGQDFIVDGGWAH